MSSSRNFLKDNKANRTSTKFYGEAPLSGRNMNDGYYHDHQRTSYNSRQFQTGIFANELTKKAEYRKKEQSRELPLELTQIVDYSNSTKVRSSKKPYDYSRQSREQSLHNYEQHFDMNENQLKEKIREQLNEMRPEMQYTLMDKIKKMMNQQNMGTRELIGDLINQTNNAFKKKDEAFMILKNQTTSIKDELGKLSKSYEKLSKDSQEKFENLCMEMSSRKNKTGEYNMDLKNSFQGMNSSLSVNLGNQGQTSKLVHEFYLQLDSQNRDLTQIRTIIDELTTKVNSKPQEVKSVMLPKEEFKSDLTIFNKNEVSKMIRDAFVEEKKKNKFEEKMQAFQTRLKEIQQIIFTQQANIKGMNDEFGNTVNNQLSPKIKKVQTAIIDIMSRIDPVVLENLITDKITSEINFHLKNSKVLKIRNCNKSESEKLSILKGRNQDKITFKQTYLLDEQNYLLDSEGNYLVEQINNVKQRIKIDNALLYILQLKGIEITNAS